MGIMRMGYAHVRVTDMTEAKNHYASTLGLYETLEDTSPEGNKRVFYKGWDEWDHHSVVLEEGGVGVVKYGWKVEHEADIDDVEAKAKAFGLTVERMSKGDNPEIGDGIRSIVPTSSVVMREWSRAGAPIPTRWRGKTSGLCVPTSVPIAVAWW